MGLPLKAPLVAREIDGDLILHDRRSHNVHRLNSVAGLIWQLCDGARDAGAITSEVAALFGKPPSEVRPDVDAILAEFTASALINSIGDTRRETALLLRCVRAALGTGDAVRESNLIGDHLDWAYVTRTALQHGVMPLLYRSLRATGREAVPATVLDRLRDQYRENARETRLLFRELLELLAVFEAHDIRVMPLKGPVLARSLYGSVAARQFGDLDVFVPVDQAARARDLLVARGYEFLSWGDTEASAVRSTAADHISVDLQWALAPDRFRSPIELEYLWEHLAPIFIRNTKVWQPEPVDQALILCAHGAKHCWSSLGWIADLAAFTRRHENSLDWREVLVRARRRGGERQLLLGLRLTRDLLGINVPTVLSRLHDDAVVTSLASEFSERLFLPKGRPSFQGSYDFVEGGLVYIRTRERLRDKIPYARRLLAHRLEPLTAMITPNQHDRAVIQLPASLAFLYYLVRPARLFGKYSARVMVRSAPSRPQERLGPD